MYDVWQPLHGHCPSPLYCITLLHIGITEINMWEVEACFVAYSVVEVIIIVDLNTNVECIVTDDTAMV